MKAIVVRKSADCKVVTVRVRSWAPLNLMIILKPDRKIKSRFKEIDFETLSLVFSILFNNVYKVKKKRSFIINLKLTAGIFSYYCFQPGRTVRMNISEVIFDEKQFYTTLLHEFRHFCQDKAFRIPLTKKYYDDRTEQRYLASPAEIDADSFSINNLNSTLNLYRRLLRFKKSTEMYSKFNGTNL